MKNIINSLILILLVTISVSITHITCLSCNNPKISVTTFSTEDATILTQLAHISEFTLKCNDNNIGDGTTSLFAEFPCGKIVPVAQVNDHKYQISWIEDIKKNSNDNVVLHLLDEEGYANLRKAQRNGDDDGDSNNDSHGSYNDNGSNNDNGKMKRHNVKPLIDITVTVKSAYKGPWIKAELLAAMIMGIIAYFAVSIKSKVQA